MKKGIALSLVFASGAAVAAPPGSWLEVDYGRLSTEEGETVGDDGSSQRLAARIDGEEGAFIRTDFRRDTLEINTAATVTTAPSGTTFEIPSHALDNRRDFLGVSFGRTVPLSESMLLTGELGYGRIEYRTEYVLVAYDEDADTFELLGVHENRVREDSWNARLALDSNVGGFTWGVEGEYFDSAPAQGAMFGEVGVDSAIWWSARVGYDLGNAVNIGLRYADTDEFTSTAISLRWRP